MTQKIKKLLTEPLLHFLLIGLAIFLSSYYVSKKREIHRIIIDKAVIGKLTMAWESQFGRPPNSNELKMAMDDYIKQEVLVREAQQLGLNQDDEIIKRRLQQKMTFIIKDNIIIPDPAPALLEAYFSQHAGKFSEKPTVSFSHIYFSADNSSYESARQRAFEILHSMEGKPARSRAPELGDHFMLLYDYNNIDKTEAQGLFGDSPFADSLFTVNENKWAGPFLSGYGWHLLYVNKRQGKTIPPLSEIKSRVIQSYKDDKINQMDNDAMVKLVEKYHVEFKID
jgi:peptidyl-prolyl cis-trans isomerase C